MHIDGNVWEEPKESMQMYIGQTLGNVYSKNKN